MNFIDQIFSILYICVGIGCSIFVIVDEVRRLKVKKLTERIKELNATTKCNIDWRDIRDVQVYMPEEFYGNNPGFSHFTFERTDNSLTHVKQAIKFVEDYQEEESKYITIWSENDHIPEMDFEVIDLKGDTKYVDPKNPTQAFRIPIWRA